MSDLGFWRLAENDGSWTALIDGGEAISAGDLLARSNQLARGLQAIGLSPGDTVAVVMPNCREFIELYLAALQVGLIYTPINHHLVGPEIAYIVDDSEAGVLIGHEAFAHELQVAADAVGLGVERRFAIGDVAGYRDFAELGDDQSTDTPEGRTAGMAMHYTSGTTGRPKGVRRQLAEMDPSELFALYALFATLFGVQPFDDNVHLTSSPLYHTAVLMWTGNSLHLGHTVVLMEKWTPEECLRLIDQHRVTTSHMVPTQFHRMLQLPEEVRSKYDVSSTRCMVHAAAPCPPEIKKQMDSDLYQEHVGLMELSADVDEIIAKANENPHGLGGSIWGSDIAKAKELAQRLEAGTVWVNKHGAIQPNVPFGGVKCSGIGVEFGEEGLKEYTNVQIVWV